MKKESKLQIIKIILFLLIIISVITINSNNKSKLLNIDNQIMSNEEIISNKEILPNKEEIIYNKEIEDTISIEDLKGTCPRGRSCTTPSCSLWSDLNKNGMCDRGEK